MAAGNPICRCSSTAAWMSKLEESIDHSKLVLTLFSAEWSELSKGMYSTLLELSKKYPAVICCNIDVEEAKEVVDTMIVRKIPSLLMLWKGKEVERIKGAIDIALLEKKILSYISAPHQ